MRSQTMSLKIDFKNAKYELKMYHPSLPVTFCYLVEEKSHFNKKKKRRVLE